MTYMTGVPDMEGKTYWYSPGVPVSLVLGHRGPWQARAAEELLLNTRGEEAQCEHAKIIGCRCRMRADMQL